MSNLLEMRGVSKSFFGVKVLDDVSIALKKGEIHALVGENGAGKSTLMKILSGVYKCDEGEIYIDGERVSIQTPADARKNGINIVYQEISLVDQMSIADNMFLGAELKGRIFHDKNQQRLLAQSLLAELHLDVDVNAPVGSLSVAQQQMIEIGKAILFRAKILILDEPTASLSEREAGKLFAQMSKLTEQGITIIYISHRLPEIFAQTDRTSILRDGKLVCVKPTSEYTHDEMIRLMVGRDVTEMFESTPQPGGEVVLQVKEFENKSLKKVSLELRKGEILGLFGLVGAGRTELARAIYGVDRISGGELFINGKKTVVRMPSDCIKNSLVLLPEDRKHCGLILDKSVGYNITLTVLKQFIRGLVSNQKKEKEIIDVYSNKLSIKMKDANTHCVYLSGGNQQKVVVSKWLAANAEIMIFDEPTRGIDIGAKHDIYQLMFNLTLQGKSILMISSEMQEILNMSNRIAVMHEGRLAGILDRDYINSHDTKSLQETIMQYAVGGCN